MNASVCVVLGGGQEGILFSDAEVILVNFSV